MKDKGEIMSKYSAEYYEAKRREKYYSARDSAKRKCEPKTCIFCKGKEITDGNKFKVINSHTVPRYVLERLSDHHCYKSSWNYELSGFENRPVGIKDSGIFRMLCKTCDDKLFEHYEKKKENLKDDSLVETIVVETTIKSMFKKQYDLLFTLRFMEEYIDDDNNVCSTDWLKIYQYYKLLYESMNIEINRLWDSFDANKIEMEVVYRKTLPYSVKVAAQGALLYCRGFETSIKLDEYTILPWLYLTVLPLENETFILLVKHKTDIEYDRWITEFNAMSDIDKLVIINDMIFRELDDYFLSQDIDTSDLNQLHFNKDDTFDSLKTKQVKIKNYLLQNS